MFISIVTPSYNRAYTLERLFLSLTSQSCINFEWIVIDDGSTDNTKELMGIYIDKSNFVINYYYQNNKGKPSAINYGVKKAKGDYIFIVDSDDMLTIDSIEIIYEKIKLHESLNNIFSGLCFRKATLDGQLLGGNLSNNVNDCQYLNSTELKNLFNVDLAYIFKRSIMLEHPFPYFKGEKFVPELYIWNKITDFERVYVYINKIIYLCEYLPDGLSANFKQQLKKNPRGFALYYFDQIKREKSLINKLKMIIRFMQCEIYTLLKD